MKTTTAVQRRQGGHFPLSAMLAERADHYGAHIRDFARYAGEHGAGNEVTLALVTDYFRDLNGTGYAANTKRIRRQAVKARLHAVIDGRVDFNAAAAFREALSRLDHSTDTRAPKVQAVPVGRDRVIERHDFERMLSAASVRDALLLRFMWQTGCRVSELCGARVERCEVKGPTAHVTVMGKGKKERTLRITAELFDGIRSVFGGVEYLFETGGGHPFSRCYVSTRVHRLAFSVLGRRLGAHALRHSFATRLIRRTGKIEAVSRALGHSTPAITMSFYVHESLDDGELFDVEEGVRIV
jgi:integrase/recombinase XerD